MFSFTGGIVGWIGHQCLAIIYTFHSFVHVSCLETCFFFFFNCGALVLDQSPRRNCCRVVAAKKRGSMVIDVGVCKGGEISEVSYNN